jgi:glycosyl transferase family 25
MKIFVVHYKKLINRKTHIINQFIKYNITNYEFIEIDRDELYNHNICMFEQNYSNSQIAISLSHFNIYKQIMEKYDNALILEDDVIFDNDFNNKFNKILMQLPNDYDMLFIGNGCNFHIHKNRLIPNKLVYKKYIYPTKWAGNGATRCTDSYLINKKCAINMCKYINNLSYKINKPIDWFLNTAIQDNNFNIYWAEPTIVTQGTQNNTFITSH